MAIKVHDSCHCCSKYMLATKARYILIIEHGNTLIVLVLCD